MQLLADENFPKALVEWLRERGNDVVWVRTTHPGWKDAALLDLAESESRIVLTLDADFWQLAIQRRSPLRKAGVVLFRARPATVERLRPLVRAFAEAAGEWAGHISRVSDEGIEMIRGGRIGKGA